MFAVPRFTKCHANNYTQISLCHRLCTYQRPSRGGGVWPQGHMEEWRGIYWLLSLIFGPGRGHWTAIALPRQDTRGETREICNMAAILKMKDPDRGNGFQNGDGENKKIVTGLYDSHCSQTCTVIFAFRGCYCLGSFRLQDLLHRSMIMYEKVGKTCKSWYHGPCVKIPKANQRN